MKYIVSVVYLLLLFSYQPVDGQQQKLQTIKRTIIEISASEENQIPEKKLKWSDAEFILDVTKSAFPVRTNHSVKWYIESIGPFIFHSASVIDTIIGNLVEPGDSIYVTFKKGEINYSGIGAEKLNLYSEIEKRLNQIKKPPIRWYSINSLLDFYKWNTYCDQRNVVVNDVLNRYKSKISIYAFNFIKSTYLEKSEADRCNGFLMIYTKRKEFNLPNEGLISIYDSLIRNQDNIWLQTEEATGKTDAFMYIFSAIEVNRDSSFRAILVGDPQARFHFFELAHIKIKQIFIGRQQERALVYQLADKGIRGLRMNPLFEKLLGEYYESPGFPEYKAYLKEFEEREMKRGLATGIKAPYFALKDEKGNEFTLDRLKGKPALLFFWKVGCPLCKEFSSSITSVLKKFDLHNRFSIISISNSTNREQWIQAITAKKNNIPNSTHLFVDDNAQEQSIFKGYRIEDFPTIFLLDVSGKIVRYPFPNPVLDKGKYLSDQIDHQLALLKDGPYVRNNLKNITSHIINNSSVSSEEWNNRKSVRLVVATDKENITFPVALKNKISIEPSEFLKPEKLFVLSDIEGNFDSFRKLLQKANIIDEKFNWIFSAGHLVFAGDMFDRGNQVTECLWLIYSLEEKARKAGGYVHFILGNHEIMNLSGDTRYVEPKYLKNSKLLNIAYQELYGENSELGKWLRSKNIIEKVGDLVFVHGGISSEFSKVNISLAKINEAARSFYDQQAKASKDSDAIISTIFGSKTSPFWYRGYYTPLGQPGKTTDTELNESLNRFNAKRIVTGHTIVSDTISVHYDGRIINTDTKHAKGISEALLIEGANFYRVNAEGQRVLLFKDEEK
ncbi:metallophosphoesterase [Pedobacter frigoris]|uniref:metallophosphoesterase n=1 Tax=Pedobacter frigoris TaxID=2571272 RepID=UPI00293125C8|nr:metallophosphoesterase [Pedobacter frigoris]